MSRLVRALLACLLTIPFAACTKTESTSPRPHGDAAAPAAEGANPRGRGPTEPAKSDGWRPNPELETALEKLAFDKDAAENLSDAAVLELGEKSYLVVVSDEGHEFGVVTLGPNAESKVYDLGALPHGDIAVELPRKKSKVEVDLEAVTTEGKHVFLAGSASLKRKKPKAGDHAGKRLEEIVPASGPGANFSNYVYELSAREGAGGFPEFELVGAHDARELLLGLPLVATFKDVPSKDNGLDVEGVLARGGYFYFGLRGPVLRGRALLVRTRADFTEPETYTLDLDGLGVRALSAVDGTGAAGLYILAGPTLTREDRFELFRFTGGEKSPSDVLTSDLSRVATVPSTDTNRPEAVFTLGSDACVLADGVRGGAPRCHPRF